MPYASTSTSASPSTAIQWRTLDTVGLDEDGTPIPSRLLGPILVGVLLNSFVYGIVFLHWIQYTLGRNRDSRYLRCVCLLSSSCSHVLWVRRPFMFYDYHVSIGASCQDA